MLQLHLEPSAPLEISELTASLSALAHRYAMFIDDDKTLGKGSDAKLLVWSVAPGSIDISLIPDITSVAGIFATLYDPLDHIIKFGKSIKDFLGFFEKKKEKNGDLSTIKDCNDAINFASSIANHGGHQTINIVNGDVIMPILFMSAESAREIVKEATTYKALSRQSGLEIRQRVPLVWSRLDREKSKSDGQTPDKAVIEEIDAKAKSVFFTDEMAFLKSQMILDEENPYQMVYFVDVEVSSANGKVASYRVIAYHGKDDLS